MINPLTGTPFEPRRVLGHHVGTESGPTLLVLSGVHGNEPSGCFALEAVFRELAEGSIPLWGTVIGVMGNLAAFRVGKRFVDHDLNRTFSAERIAKLRASNTLTTSEDRELLELAETIDALVPQRGPRYFLDCHTTSGETVPYVSVLPDEHCLAFASQLPAHRVVSHERQPRGISDEYLRERGLIGCTFEAGRHETLASIEHQRAMIWEVLRVIGAVNTTPGPTWETLAKHFIDGIHTFDIDHVERIEPETQFRMEPNYFNFRRIVPGELLAHRDSEPVHAQSPGRIFMPLYQPLGDEGFSIVRERTT